MKKVITFTLFVLFLGTMAIAQNTTLQELLKNMSQEEKMELLQYAKQEQTNVDKELAKIMKKLPAASQTKVLERAKEIQDRKTIVEVEMPNRIIAESIEKEVPLTTIQYDNESFDFGTVKEGKVVQHTFRFKNTGTLPLTITNARGSCGCTVPKWSREAIPPGEEGEIMVNFNSKGKIGKRNQIVTITANTNPQRTTLRLVGEVLKATN